MKTKIIKICPKCNSEHSLSGIYCSSKCSHSRTFTEDSRRKKSESNKKYWISLTENEKIFKTELLINYAPYGTKKKYLGSLLTQEWEVLGIQAKRLRVILEQNGKCNKCGLSHWNNERITLEYEHIDGNKANNCRDNVEALCPNCHSQTKTWRGRKNGIIQNRIKIYLDNTE